MCVAQPNSSSADLSYLWEISISKNITCCAFYLVCCFSAKTLTSTIIKVLQLMQKTSCSIEKRISNLRTRQTKSQLPWNHQGAIQIASDAANLSFFHFKINRCEWAFFIHFVFLWLFFSLGGEDSQHTEHQDKGSKMDKVCTLRFSRTRSRTEPEAARKASRSA